MHHSLSHSRDICLFIAIYMQKNHIFSNNKYLWVKVTCKSFQNVSLEGFPKTFSYILSHVSFGSWHERSQFHILVFWTHLHQDFLKGVEGWSFSINIVLVDLTKSVKQWENYKLLWRHIVYCMQCLRFERNMFKNQRKCNQQKIQCF